MPSFFEQVQPKLEQYKIFIIEQTDDGEKFNRGKLLNVGYTLAKAEGFDAFVLHDVDLLPRPDLRAWYSVVPALPLHIAWVWDNVSGYGIAYNTYVGGVMSLSSEHMERTNGYPNNYWGWGGEDDEFRRRLEEADMKILRPSKGTIIDVEAQVLKERGGKRAGAKGSKVRDDERIEKNFEHEENWRENGLANLRFEELCRECLDQEPTTTDKDVVVKVTVELFKAECPKLRVKLSWTKDRNGGRTVEVDETGRGLQGRKWKMPAQRMMCYVADSPTDPEQEWRKCKKGPAERQEIPHLPKKQSCFWMA
jgi:hypothetical protein